MESQTKAESKGLKAIVGETRLIVPHLDGELTFIHPAKRGTYFSLAEQLAKDKLSQPTLAETASLVHTARQNPEYEYSNDIIHKLKSQDH